MRHLSRHDLSSPSKGRRRRRRGALSPRYLPQGTKQPAKAALQKGRSHWKCVSSRDTIPLFTRALIAISMAADHPSLLMRAMQIENAISPHEADDPDLEKPCLPCPAIFSLSVDDHCPKELLATSTSTRWFSMNDNRAYLLLLFFLASAPYGFRWDGFLSDGWSVGSTSYSKLVDSGISFGLETRDQTRWHDLAHFAPFAL